MYEDNIKVSLCSFIPWATWDIKEWILPQPVYAC